ncbi:MAG TPA: cysteine desulfurase family protein [Clostridia bacterium]|nr:cysteine desulfurase family protein [Clostridia bacterium]
MYFDHAATSPPSEKLNRSLYELSSLSGYNPSSSHKLGLEQRKRLENVRTQIARLIGARPEEIYFTSGATESNNLALQGFCYKKKGHIISSAVEHDSVEKNLDFLESQGFNVTRLSPKNLTSKQKILEHLRDDTILVSLMSVQNETGEHYGLDGLGEALRKKNIVYHRDCVQTFLKLPLDVNKEQVDMACFSSHKVGGLKGLGILYCRKGLSIEPLFFGGGQESNLRPGTENTLAILALGHILKEEKMQENYNYIKKLNSYLGRGFVDLGGRLISPPDASPYILAVSFPVPSEVLSTALSLKGVYVSAGSACHARSGKEARIAPYLASQELARGMLRFSFSVENTHKEAETMLEILSQSLKELKKYL